MLLTTRRIWSYIKRKKTSIQEFLGLQMAGNPIHELQKLHGKDDSACGPSHLESWAAYICS